MSDNDTNEDAGGQKRNLGALNEDTAHPFDQTNDIVDGLEGDADDPEVVEKAQKEAEEPAVLDPLVDRKDVSDADSGDETRP